MSLDNSNVHGADDLVRRLAEAQRYVMHDLPHVVGTEAVNHFKESFQNEGFTDKSLQKWAARKTKRKGNTNNQKVLSGKTGELGDATAYRVSGHDVIIHNDKVYAQIHNEGLDGKAWGKHPFKMPKRQFIGDSQQLDKKISEKVTRDFTRILKS